MFGLFYLGFLPSYWIKLRDLADPVLAPNLASWQWTQSAGLGFTLLACFLIVATDIGSYVIGRRLGRHPLSPISPGKTVEGAIGGVALEAVIARGLELDRELPKLPVVLRQLAQLLVLLALVALEHADDLEPLVVDVDEVADGNDLASDLLRRAIERIANGRANDADIPRVLVVELVEHPPVLDHVLIQFDRIRPRADEVPWADTLGAARHGDVARAHLGHDPESAFPAAG